MVLYSAIGKLECGAWVDGNDCQNKEKISFTITKKIRVWLFYLCNVS